MLLLKEDDAEGQVFNVGANQEISINDLAEKVVAVTHSRSAIVHVPYDQAYEIGFEDMERRVPNTARLRALTGWQPTHSIDEIIQDVANDLQARV